MSDDTTRTHSCVLNPTQPTESNWQLEEGFLQQARHAPAERETTKHGRSSPAPSPKEDPRPCTTIRNVPPPSPRENPKKGVYSSVLGDNGELMERIAALYFKPADRIADVTFGKGVFWRQIDTTRYDFHPSDLKTCPQSPHDFRKLPYQDGEFDVVVLDPPYMHNPGATLHEANYRNAETTKGLSHAGIIQLYEAGMTEAMRILKPGGLLLVKCQDEIESGRQQWSHIEVRDIACRLGMTIQDLFVVTQRHAPRIQRREQKHARKNHSYMWVFKGKPVVAGKTAK